MSGGKNKYYDYFESKILSQRYAVHKISGDVIFQDGVRYSAQEIRQLKNATPEEIKNIHNVKKVMDGTIIKQAEGEKNKNESGQSG